MPEVLEVGQAGRASLSPRPSTRADRRLDPPGGA